VTPTNATRNQTINMADPINYITTMDILLGTPPQKQTLMFDLNFPTTVIYQSNCFQKSDPTLNCTEAPYYVNQSWVMEDSTTFQNYS